MPTLNGLSPELKAHWQVHLTALRTEFGNIQSIRVLIQGNTTLPNVKHPAYIHDWWEANPAQRLIIEGWN